MGRSQAGRPEGPHPLIHRPCDPWISSSITGTFAKDRSPPLSPCPGYVTHALLTLPPLTLIKLPFTRSVRLACLSHAASVRSEPGSNSSIFLSLHRLGPEGPHRRLHDKRAQTNSLRVRMLDQHTSTACLRRRQRTTQHRRRPHSHGDQLFTCQRAVRQGLRATPTPLST